MFKNCSSAFWQGLLYILLISKGIYLEEALAAFTSAYTVVLAGRIIPTHCTGALSLGATRGRRGQAVS